MTADECRAGCGEGGVMIGRYEKGDQVLWVDSVGDEVYYREFVNNKFLGAFRKEKTEFETELKRWLAKEG